MDRKELETGINAHTAAIGITYINTGSKKISFGKLSISYGSQVLAFSIN